MEHNQLSLRNALDIMGQFLGETAVKNLLCLFVPEPLDHNQIITEGDIIVKGY